MINQPGSQVNAVNVSEVRMSFIHFMPALALLHSLSPPTTPCPFLASDVDFQNEYERALANEIGNAPAGSTSSRTPWWNGYGKLFWARNVPNRNSYDMGRALVPIDYNLAPYVTNLTLANGTVTLSAYLYPWGIGVLVDVTLVGSWPLNDAVNLIVDIHNSPKIQWTFDNASGTASPAGLAAALRTRLGAVIYGGNVAQETAGDQFSIVTVIEAANVLATDPIVENGPIHYAIEGMTGWKRNWHEIPPKPNSLVESRISSSSAPIGHIMYGKGRRARAVWFPADFRPAVGYPDTLSCYHQNLSVASLHTEALCVLAQDAAAQLQSQGSLAAFSVAYRNYAQLAAGILGRLHGKKTDDSSVRKPLYRSGSIRSQILIYKDEVNQLRLAIPSINSPLDT